jgi:RNA-directed DNA polymerase
LVPFEQDDRQVSHRGLVVLNGPMRTAHRRARAARLRELRQALREVQAKTRIVHIDEGFNFLGFTIRRFKGKLLTMPQKEKVKAHVRRLKGIVVQHQQSRQATLVKQLNPVITGWTNYYQHGASSRTFHRVGHELWRMLWHWGRRRHPNKPKRWLYRRYWKQVGQRRWVFGDKDVTLRHPSDTHITRWVKVRGRSSPYDPALRDYWAARQRRGVVQQTESRRKRKVLMPFGRSCGSREPVVNWHRTLREDLCRF